MREAERCGKKNQELQDRYVAHQVMVANFRIALTLATRERSDVRLLFFHREGHALRDQATATHRGRRLVLPINPDGFFGLQFPHMPDGRNRAFFFLEADRSTMTRQRVLQKLVGYWEWYIRGGHTRKHGIRAFRVLTVIKSEARMENLLRVAREIDDARAGSPIFWFTAVPRLSPGLPPSVLDPIWQAADRPEMRVNLLPGKGDPT